MRATKDSGVDWLGEVPHNWDVNRLKRVFRRVKRELTPDLGIVTAFRDGQVTLRSNRRSEGFTEADDYSNYQRIEPNDLAIHAMDAFAGAIGVCDSTGMCSPVLSVCSPLEGSEPRYMAYVLRIMANRGWIEALSRSIRERTSEFRWAEAGTQHVPIPPNDEQRRIADFLDRETAKIDALIATQEQLITTLDERRGAVISRAVTRGLVEDRPLRDSGVQWMPSIPESWKPIRMPFAASVVSRDYQDEFGLLSVYLNRGVILYSEGGGLVHKPSEDLSNYQHVVPGDIVLNNQQAWRGSVGVSRHFGNVSPAYIVLRPITNWHPGYLNYLLRSPFIVTQLEVASRGVGDIQRQISRPWMREVVFPLPHVNEQLEIANYLDHETVRIDQLRAEASRMIMLLAERRQALISAAVTGKLEVGV